MAVWERVIKVRPNRLLKRAAVERKSVSRTIGEGAKGIRVKGYV